MDENEYLDDEIQEETSDNDELENIDFEDIFGLKQDDSEEQEEEVEEEEDREQQEEEPVDEQKEPYYDNEQGYWVDPGTGEKLLSQSQVNEIVGNARIKGRSLEQAAQMIEQQTGMPLDQVAAKLKEQEVQQYVEEWNIPEEKAKQIVENEEARKYLEEHLMYITERQQQQQHQMEYNSQKANYINNPIIKQYEREIDNLAQHGKYLSWDIAMKQVLGEKFAAGELKDNMESTAAKRMARTRKPSMSPEIGGGAGYSEPVIPKEIQFLSAQLGVDPKESFEEYQKIEKEKKRGFL